ncbi:MAG: hypothetical protein K8W52_23610 [Deltaproteobacteria bacterium]|nr:hypothetical protein [Deltaproteobacteria bacterium]
MSRWITVCVGLALALGACDLVLGTGPDPGPRPDAPGRCAELRARYQARLAAEPRSCAEAQDCTTVGGIDPPTCNGGISIGTCSGDPVNIAVASDPELVALEAAFAQECTGPSSGLPVTWDCAPSDVDCVDHRCVAVARSCFGPPDARMYPDAYLPDAFLPPPDAP